MMTVAVSRPRPVTTSWRTVAGELVSFTPVISCTLGLVCLPERSRVMGVQAVGGSWLIWVTRDGERGRRVRNFTPRWLSSPRTGWVVTLESRISRCGSAPEAAFQWSQKAMTSRAWVALEMSALAYTRLWVPESWAKKVSTDRARWDRLGT